MVRENSIVEMSDLGWHIDAIEEFLHETVDHVMEHQNNTKETDNMNSESVIIWTQENCPLCQKIKDIFGEGNYTEKQAADLLGGSEPNDEALTQLAMQDMQLPLVMVEGEWKDVGEIIRQRDTSAA